MSAAAVLLIPATTAAVAAVQIQFEVRLPTQTYRQRYLQTGCGGLCRSRDQRPRTPARFI
ncbi:tannase/feruloyl esterase family alpha/beta hydrolase [Actinoplanes sp. ATCC 53533]|uniref:tannase/feruloyl esterase family alpha/beta hydrolase n=1 Tax=Actinoplanes sp. ATCC 53533 TaxID=1288362 RepID=UPI0013155F73|nr:tannase/feruloyl esterase family alpha/beta hydrolase [Actinoplanes sp. ATCC 53533]